MTKKSILVFKIILFIVFSIIAVVVYLQYNYTLTTQSLYQKNKLVSISTLPDLALSTQTSYIRHRSLSDTFSKYKDDPTLREYFPSTFVYSQGIK